LLLIDDSIVRGTQLRETTEFLYQSGAKEIITCLFFSVKAIGTHFAFRQSDRLYQIVQTVIPEKYIGGLPMGISILIVDDDKLLVEKLEETVNWSGIGIDMVFTANNIRQAQKLLEEYPIEMLLCDIDMPQGNGLELLEWIRYKKLDIECTFLSSYANFAYAHTALKLSSREYLLKPISNADLETALRRIVGIVQEKHQKQKKQEKKGENEKQFWEDLLVQCLQEEYWIESSFSAICAYAKFA